MKAKTSVTHQAHVDGTKKRKYSPRSRACKVCGVDFKPKKRGASKFCSNKCRVANHRAEKVKAAKRAGVLVQPLCEWCNAAPTIKGSRFCSVKHRRASWEVTRVAAVNTFVVHNLRTLPNVEREKLLDMFENIKMRKVRVLLKGWGYTYHPEKRAWQKEIA